VFSTFSSLKMKVDWQRSPENAAPKRVCHVFRKKKKGGNDNKKMITLNDNINDNSHPVQGKKIKQK
jgi:hypothetical protein